MGLFITLLIIVLFFKVVLGITGGLIKLLVGLLVIAGLIALLPVGLALIGLIIPIIILAAFFGMIGFLLRIIF